MENVAFKFKWLLYKVMTRGNLNVHVVLYRYGTTSVKFTKHLFLFMLTKNFWGVKYICIHHVVASLSVRPSVSLSIWKKLFPEDYFSFYLTMLYYLHAHVSFRQCFHIYRHYCTSLNSSQVWFSGQKCLTLVS